MVIKSEIEISYNQQKELLQKRVTTEMREKLSQIQMNEDFIIVITGIRRCGKSTLMHQLLKSVSTNKLAFFNFEDPRVFGFDNNDFIKLDEIIGTQTQYLAQTQAFE